jgi:hypothetical protein
MRTWVTWIVVLAVTLVPGGAGLRGAPAAVEKRGERIMGRRGPIVDSHFVARLKFIGRAMPVPVYAAANRSGRACVAFTLIT